MKRRCLCGCGQLVTGSRCTTSRKQQRAKYNSGWTEHAQRAVATHRATYGDVCPGFEGHAPHDTDDLVLDHGPPEAVMCRAWNSAKRNLGMG